MCSFLKIYKEVAYSDTPHSFCLCEAYENAHF